MTSRKHHVLSEVSRGEASAWEVEIEGNGSRRSITIVCAHPGPLSGAKRDEGGKKIEPENPRPDSFQGMYVGLVRRTGRYGIARFINLFNAHYWDIDAGNFTPNWREDTNRVLKAFAEQSNTILCAWGNAGYRAGIPRGDEALAILDNYPEKLMYLGLNGSGRPRGLLGTRSPTIMPWVR